MSSGRAQGTWRMMDHKYNERVIECFEVMSKNQVP